MNYPVYVNEVPIARFNLDGTHTFYNFIIPHISPEFNKNEGNIIGIFLFPPFPPNKTVEVSVINYLKENVKNDTKIFFDNVHEGHTWIILENIYDIINKANLIPENCYYFTGGMEIEKIHKEFCIKKNINNKINVRVLLLWEKRIKEEAFRLQLAPPKILTGKKEKTFLCFNRMCRKHRVALIGLLLNKNLIKNSYTSFYTSGEWSNMNNEIQCLKNFISNDTFNTIYNNIIENLHDFPYILNLESVSENANYVKDSDHYYYENSYFSVVTETYFFGPKENNFTMNEESSIFFSEKIFKPIYNKHPFVLLGRPKSLEYLKKIGYKTFHPYINESYDLIENDEERLLFIISEIERLANLSTQEWIDLQLQLIPVFEHNYKNLMSKGNFDYVFNDFD